MFFLFVVLASFFVSYLFSRWIYKGQKKRNPDAKVGSVIAACAAYILCFLIINTIAIMTVVSDSTDKNQQIAPYPSVSSHKQDSLGITGERFKDSYNAIVLSAKTNDVDFSKIKIKGIEAGSNALQFTINKNISGVGSKGSDGTLSGLMWMVSSDGTPQSGAEGLVSMAFAISAIDAGMPRKEALKNLSNAIEKMNGDTLVSEFSSNGFTYNLTKNNGLPFILSISKKG